MIIKKQYLKEQPVCKVTFSLPEGSVGFARTVHIVGEFNNWNTYATPMKKSKKGEFTVTVDLDKGREYQFLYLIDKSFWELDREADKLVRSPYGDCDNSVVIV
ncbi:MAG: isoamylase early set domain-containing protein [Deltaproteobacteria bacterium]|nr:isoamylase early set domain-containing protein [Deltaproteobacteria bacterium]